MVLFLHGGPGVPNRHGMAKHLIFTIVARDQRGTGAATSEGIQATALVACALFIYFFCNDKEIVSAIRRHNAETKV